MKLLMRYIPGILVVFIIAIASIVVADYWLAPRFTLSVLTVAIIMGMLLGNIANEKIPDSWRPGFLFSQGYLLRAGIILFGFRLSFQDIIDVGLAGLFIDIAVVASTLCLAYFLGRKWLKMDRETTMLTAMGSAICGAAAVMAAKPVVRADTPQVAVAVATVVLFGTLAMFAYPWLCRGLGMDDVTAGIFIGATVHEVAQVVAAGDAVSQEATQVAVIVKLTRVMLLAPAVLLVGVYLRYRLKGEDSRRHGMVIPWFVLFFIVAVGVNSFPVLPAQAVSVLNYLDSICLAMAMAALGIATNFRQMKAIGIKPFLLAFVIFIYLIMAGYCLTQML